MLQMMGVGWQVSIQIFIFTIFMFNCTFHHLVSAGQSSSEQNMQKFRNDLNAKKSAVHYSISSPLVKRIYVEPPKIALAVQGPAHNLNRFMDVVNIMKYRANMTLFLSSFDQVIDPNYCTNSTSADIEFVCEFAPHTTWTGGRNNQAKKIYEYEQLNEFQYKYWLFADHDQSQLNHCQNSTNCNKHPKSSVELAACCLDAAVERIIHPKVQYPIVYFNLDFGPERAPYLTEACGLNYLAFLHFDCGDAALYAFHRQAVPMLLPYVGELYFAVVMFVCLLWWVCLMFAAMVS